MSSADAAGLPGRHALGHARESAVTGMPFDHGDDPAGQFRCWSVVMLVGRAAVALSVLGRRVGCGVSMQARPWPQVPEATGRAARAAASKGPGQLALVTVLQFAENLTDRAAAHRVRFGMDFKYALGMELDDPGFDASVLCEFRARLVAHGLEERALDLLLAALKDKGLVKAGGRQRTDSTRVLAAVRDLNRLELAGETLRSVLEALACAAPGWLFQAVSIRQWAERYGPRIDSWQLPSSHAKRTELALAYGQDGFALLEAAHAEEAPVWLRELPAMQTFAGGVAAELHANRHLDRAGGALDVYDEEGTHRGSVGVSRTARSLWCPSTRRLLQRGVAVRTA